MGVRIDGNRAYNVPDNAHVRINKAYPTYHEPMGTDIYRCLTRTQVALSAIRRTPDNMAGYAMDCLHDIAQTLAVTAEVLARQLIAYGCTPSEIEED